MQNDSERHADIILFKYNWTKYIHQNKLIYLFDVSTLTLLEKLSNFKNRK